MPVGWPHGLGIVGIARQVAEPVQLAGAVTPGPAALVAVVLIERVESVGQAVFGENQRVGCKVLQGGVVVCPGVVPNHGGGIGVVAPVCAGFEQNVSVRPIEGLLELIKVLVGVAAGPES